MGWKIWTLVVLFSISAIFNFVDLWRGAPQTRRTDEEQMRVNLLGFLFASFMLYAILSSNLGKPCLVE